MAETNSKMKWFNVSMLGLQGTCHPLLDDVVTAHEVKKLRCQLRMLCGDFYSFSVKAEQTGNSPHCRLCEAPVEDLPHILASCTATAEPRQRTICDLEQLLTIQTSDSEIFTKVLSEEDFSQLVNSDNIFTQFLVDPTSFNLPDKYRINVNDAKLMAITRTTRNHCFSINQERLKMLRELSCT